jgi:integrase
LVISLLREWKKIQKLELQQLKIQQALEQYLFTYSKPTGEVNCPVYTDYLNHRINTLRRRHPHLAHLTPHKLRHTFATLAKQGGADISQISAALTHSDVATTKKHVNTPNVVDLKVYEAFNSVLNNEQTK